MRLPQRIAEMMARCARQHHPDRVVLRAEDSNAAATPPSPPAQARAPPHPAAACAPHKTSG
jgi:hypothetical protein